jgi:YHS domain-containing protein
MIMNAKKRHLVIAILFVGLIMLNGCKKSEPAPSETSADTMQEMQGHEGHDHVAMMDKPAEAVAAVVEQTTCPIMGTAINKALFTEHKGKKVYFCCPECEDKFKEEPEKYIAKLPQFKQ